MVVPTVMARLGRPHYGSPRVTAVADLVIFESLKVFWLFALEAVVFLSLAGYCVLRLREGAGPVLGALGGLVGGLPALMFAYAWARVEWADDFGPFETIASNDVLVQTDWARPLALALVAMALVLSRRPRSHGTT